MLLYIICGVMIVVGLLMIFFPKITLKKEGIIYKTNPATIFATRVMGVVVIILCIYYMLIDM